MPSREDLKYFQAMPLEVKVGMTKTRIREWVKEYGTDGVYVSFSGGKDSTALLHIVRGMYSSIESVFVDTGLEYPEIREFVKTFSNVTIIRPKMRFDEVIKKYGYPIISKEVAECVYGARRFLKGIYFTLKHIEVVTLTVLLARIFIIEFYLDIVILIWTLYLNM